MLRIEDTIHIIRPTFINGFLDSVKKVPKNFFIFSNTVFNFQSMLEFISSFWESSDEVRFDFIPSAGSFYQLYKVFTFLIGFGARELVYG